jgi:uncharacterized protein
MKRVLLDPRVILYALGGSSAQIVSCRRVLALGADNLRFEAPTDLVREVLHHRARRLGDRTQAATEALWAALLCVLHPVESQEANTAAEVFGGHPTLSARCAIFVAFAQRHNLTTIISTDGNFDGLPGLRRIDPCDEVALSALME